MDWKLVKESENIKVFVCKLPNSPLKKVKVETIVESNLSQLVSVIRDADNHSDWVFLNDESYVLEKNDDCHWKYYGSNDLPWPVSDRDFITQAYLVQDSSGIVKIISKALPDFIPEKEDYIRIQNIHSVWTLSPIQKDRIHISFELEIDIGGKIPVWLINMAIAKGPYNSMKGLREIIDSKRFADTHLTYINDTTCLKNQAPYSVDL